jgi:hypothetical protein
MIWLAMSTTNSLENERPVGPGDLGILPLRVGRVPVGFEVVLCRHGLNPGDVGRRSEGTGRVPAKLVDWPTARRAFPPRFSCHYIYSYGCYAGWLCGFAD